MVGAARRAHELALDHACTRHQFGRPIGSFQAVSQRVAAAHIDVTAAEMLLARAADAWDAGEPNRVLPAELAVAFGRAAASRVQFAAHHTLAAIGYFEEHEAPWLFRRVHADVAHLDAFVPSAGDAADQLVERDGSLPRFRLSEEAEAFRAELRALIAEHVPASRPMPTSQPDEGLISELAARGLLGMAWPVKYGGRDASIEESLVLVEELGYGRAGMSMVTAAVDLVGHAIARHGTHAQRERFLPLIRSGILRACLGYSEPEAGSDLASLRTRAERDGDEWVVNGQKLWTTGGHLATHVWLATRTDPDAPKPHAGITVFLVPMDTPGITVQQHRSLAGEISCTVFYDDVRVPDDARVGEVNGGWKVITDALAVERVAMGAVVARGARLFDEMLAAARRDVDGTVGPRGSAARCRIRDLAAKLHATRALVVTAARATAAGAGVRLEAPMAKVLGGEVAEEFGVAMLEIFGPTAALSEGTEGAIAAFEQGLRGSIVLVVGGGTNDIQRSLIARGLGLPR